MRRKFVAKKYILIPFALLVGVILACIISALFTKSHLDTKKSDLAELYRVSQLLEIDQQQIDLEQFAWWQLPQNIQLIQTANEQLVNLSGRKSDVEQVESAFDQEYIKFTQFAQTYKTQPSLAATLEQVAVASDKVEFKQKREPQKYIQSNYNRLREAVKFINLNSKTGQIKWQYLPELEVSAMTLAEKVSQLFIWTIKGQQLNGGDQAFLKDFAPGGIILMGENISNESQVKTLTKNVQATNPLYPLLISTDQEGSPVKRIGWDSTRGQKAMTQLSTNDACKQYGQRDDLLSGLGINLNYGIVADITNDSKSFIFSRVFSGDAAKASDYTRTAVGCTIKTLTTVKHFPGHGRTGLDTHNIIASYDLPLTDWQNSDGKVFQSAIDNGVDLVMMGHLNYPQITKGQPASLSADAVNYLRKEMKFSGLIVTDDLGMLSRNKSRNTMEDLKSAFKAGNDLLLYVIEPVDRWKARQAIVDLVQSDPAFQLSLDSQVKRILVVKSQL